MTTADRFLRATLGPGADAVLELVDDPLYAGYVLPRVVGAWLREAPRTELLPGTRVAATLRKSETGWGGVVQIHSETYAFRDQSAAHATAAVVAALGAEPRPVEARGLDLARLGRTLDALVKAQARRGGEAPGPAAKPAEVAAPDAPEAAEPRQPAGVRRLPRTPQLTKVRLSESQARFPCKVCGEKQVVGGKFRGCACVKGLKKGEATPVSGGGFDVDLLGWSTDDVSAYRRIING